MSEAAERPAHPAVPHPAHLQMRRDLIRYEKRFWGRTAVVNDWLATHLGLVFGSVWVVWVFFIWPLAAQFMDAEVQAKTSYYAQSWVQLYALPLFVYIGNRLQRSSDAQSEAMHTALTHIATVSDQNKTLIEQNTALTEQVHMLTGAVHDRLLDMREEATGVAVVPEQDAPGTRDGSDPVDPGVGQPSPAQAAHRQDDSRADQDAQTAPGSAREDTYEP